MVRNRSNGHVANEAAYDEPDGDRYPEDDPLPFFARLWNLGPWFFILSTLESCALELSLSRDMYSFTDVSNCI